MADPQVLHLPPPFPSLPSPFSLTSPLLFLPFFLPLSPLTPSLPAIHSCPITCMIALVHYLNTNTLSSTNCPCYSPSPCTHTPPQEVHCCVLWGGWEVVCPVRQLHWEEVLVALVVQVLADAQAALQSNHVLGEGGHSCIIVFIVLQV